MIDIQLIRRDPGFVVKSLLKRGVEFDVKEFTNLEMARKDIQIKSETLQNQKNQIAKKIGQLKSSGESIDSLLTEAAQIPKYLDELNKKLFEIQNKISDWLSSLPNLPHHDVPEGKNEECNLEVKRWGQIPEFTFKPKEHSELGVDLGLDFELASDLSGSRFVFLKGPLARLHRALVQFMLDYQTSKNNYLECYTPYIVNKKTLYGTGQLPKFEEDLFSVKKGGDLDKEESLYLIPTAEVSLTNLAANLKSVHQTFANFLLIAASFANQNPPPSPLHCNPTVMA